MASTVGHHLVLREWFYEQRGGLSTPSLREVYDWTSERSIAYMYMYLAAQRSSLPPVMVLTPSTRVPIIVVGSDSMISNHLEFTRKRVHVVGDIDSSDPPDRDAIPVIMRQLEI